MDTACVIRFLILFIILFSIHTFAADEVPLNERVQGVWQSEPYAIGGLWGPARATGVLVFDFKGNQVTIQLKCTFQYVNAKGESKVDDIIVKDRTRFALGTGERTVLVAGRDVATGFALLEIQKGASALREVQIMGVPYQCGFDLKSGEALPYRWKTVTTTQKNEVEVLYDSLSDTPQLFYRTAAP